MSVLRVVATVLLAAMVTSLGIVGARTLARVRERNTTERGASSILYAARACLATSSDQVLEVELFQPVVLVENRVLIEEFVYGELEGRFCRQVRLEPGRHSLRITLTENGLMVET
jgi:predicted ABC-class ATPase